MKALHTYHLNTPTTADGFSITISTTVFGTEEEIAYLKKNCEEIIGSGLVQEYSSPLTSQFKCTDSGRVVPDVLHGWRYEGKTGQNEDCN